MSEKTICKQCGREMNQHAEKFLYLEDGALGCIEEIHSCPGCGNTDSRPAKTVTHGKE